MQTDEKRERIYSVKAISAHPSPAVLDNNQPNLPRAPRCFWPLRVGPVKARDVLLFSERRSFRILPNNYMITQHTLQYNCNAPYQFDLVLTILVWFAAVSAPTVARAVVAALGF